MHKLRFTPGDIIKDTETSKCFRVFVSDRKHLIAQAYSEDSKGSQQLIVLEMDKLRNNDFGRFVVEKSIFNYDSQKWVFPEYNDESRSNFYSDETFIHVERFNPHNGKLVWELGCKWDFSKGKPIGEDGLHLIVDETNIPISVPLSTIEDEIVKVFVSKSKEIPDCQNIMDYLTGLTFNESKYLAKNREFYGYLIVDDGIWYCRYIFNDIYHISVEVSVINSLVVSQRTYHIRDFIGDNPRVRLLPTFDKGFPGCYYPREFK